MAIPPEGDHRTKASRLNIRPRLISGKTLRHVQHLVAARGVPNAMTASPVARQGSLRQGSQSDDCAWRHDENDAHDDAARNQRVCGKTFDVARGFPEDSGQWHAAPKCLMERLAEHEQS